jgi:hypothetical protein
MTQPYQLYMNNELVPPEALTCNGINTPACAACITCANTGRDIETVCLDDLIAEIESEVAYKEQDQFLTADSNAVAQKLALTLTDLSKTGILKRRHVEPIQKGVRDYYIKPPAGETIHLVHSVCVAGRCLDQNRNGNCCESGKCRPAMGGFVFEPMDKIVLDEALCVECGNIEIVYSTFVSTDACDVDKVLIERYKETLIAGTAGRLRKMAAFPWSIPLLGADLLRTYEMGKQQAAIDVATSYMTGHSSFDAGNW